MKYLKTISISILALLIVLTIYSCSFSEWHVGQLYSQKIEGTSKIIYKYDAWGGRDSHASGYVVLDSTETFEVNLNNDLPFIYLVEIPNKNIIKGVTHECDDSCGENYSKTKPLYLPIKEESTIKGNIKILNLIYQYKGISERLTGLQRYQFENFKETRDSLYFYNLDDVESMNGRHLDNLKIKKAEVIIRQDNDLYISKIEVENVVINKISEEIIEGQTYFLTPKHKLKPSAFSDYGIFKQVILKDTNSKN